MPDLEEWSERLVESYEEYNFEHGFKLVFGNWLTLEGLDTAFLTPFPGLNVPDGAVEHLIAENDGNSYQLELEDANSPINMQFMRLAKLIGRDPDEILTCVATPFRTGNWNDFNLTQKREAMRFGLEFWHEPLHCPTMRLIIVSGSLAFRLVKQIMNLNVAPTIVPSGWGEYQLRRYELENGPTIVHLPYLGRYKLLSNAGCIRQLQVIFQGILD